MAHPMQHYGERKSRAQIRATYYRHFVKHTEMHTSFDSAAIAAAWACDENTASYKEAEHLETGEKWNRAKLLDRGYDLIEEHTQ